MTASGLSVRAPAVVRMQRPDVDNRQIGVGESPPQLRCRDRRTANVLTRHRELLLSCGRGGLSAVERQNSCINIQSIATLRPGRSRQQGIASSSRRRWRRSKGMSVTASPTSRSAGSRCCTRSWSPSRSRSKGWRSPCTPNTRLRDYRPSGSMTYSTFQSSLPGTMCRSNCFDRGLARFAPRDDAQATRTRWVLPNASRPRVAELGVYCVPDSVPSFYSRPDLVFRAVIDATPSEVVLVRRRDAENPAVASFVEITRDVATARETVVAIQSDSF